MATPRTYAVLLAALLAAGALAGCAQNGDDMTPTPTPTATPTVTPTATPTGPPVVPTSVVPTLPTAPPASGPSDAYAMTTGGATGVYYAVGNGIAAAVRNATAAGFSISEVATSDGSVQNARRLKDDTHQFALMQNDVMFNAYNGNGTFAGGAITDLRAVAGLYPEMIQVVTLKSANLDSLADLANKRVVLGAPGSGAAVNAGQILNASGVSADTQYLALSDAAEQLKDGRVDAIFWTGGIPTGALVSLATTHPLRIVPIDAASKAALQAEYPFYANVTLPANTYAGQDAAVETVAVVAVLAARADVAADDVASILRVIFDGTAVQASHAQGANIKLANAFNGVVGVPWHDGARYYYLTKGMTPPS